MDPSLYLVAGTDAVPGGALIETVAAAVAGGVTMVQLREKNRPARETIELARRLRAVLAPSGVPLIVNDSIEVARAAGAHGVHLGVDDGDVAAARARLEPGSIVGVSAGTAAEAARVDWAVADYAGVGSVFATGTKPDAGPPIGIDGLTALMARIPLPVVAIGGIGPGNAGPVAATGVAGIAVVSAICGSADPKAAARALRALVDQARAARG